MSVVNLYDRVTWLLYFIQIILKLDAQLNYYVSRVNRWDRAAIADCFLMEGQALKSMYFA